MYDNPLTQMMVIVTMVMTTTRACPSVALRKTLNAHALEWLYDKPLLADDGDCAVQLVSGYAMIATLGIWHSTIGLVTLVNHDHSALS